MDVVVMVLDSTQFLLPDGSQGKSVIIFGVNNSFSVNVYNKKKNILVLAKCSTEEVDDTAGPQK